MKTTDVTIERYVWEKVYKPCETIQIPTEPLYIQEYNYRTIIGIFPQFADWDNNKLYQLQVIKVTDKKIQFTTISVNPTNLTAIAGSFDTKPKSEEDYLKDTVVRYLMDKNFDECKGSNFISKYVEVTQGFEQTFNFLYDPK